MIREKILLTVLTYPQPSISYDENFCTAGFRNDGSMIRIYPVSFYRYKDLHKYHFIEINIIKRKKGDFRPESYSPRDLNLSDLKVLNKLGTENDWKLRKELCLKNVYHDFDKLIQDSKAPKNISLAVFKPKEILGITYKEVERDWKPKWKESMKQLKLFENDKRKVSLRKLPYEFKYSFSDNKDKIHNLQILDWEIGVLYWKYFKIFEGDENEAIKKVSEQYFDSFIKRDIYFFVGTTLEWHLRRSRNPFLIIGIFYPPKIKQSHTLSLFE